MMSIFLTKQRGYTEFWTTLPNNKESFLELSVELEEELNQISDITSFHNLENLK